jgi:hypothetical protein
MKLLSSVVLACVLALFAGIGAAQNQTQEQQKRQVTQPGNNAPVWRDVRQEGKEHYTSLRGREMGRQATRGPASATAR